MIYTDDHLPPHVHVAGKGGTIIFYLDPVGGTVSLRENNGVTKKDARDIAGFLVENLYTLSQAWEQVHG